MTIFRCGTCGKPGLMCECDVATARVQVAGINPETRAKWFASARDPREHSAALSLGVEEEGREPITMSRIQRVIERIRQRSAMKHDWVAPIHPAHLRDHAFALGQMLVAEGDCVMTSEPA